MKLWTALGLLLIAASCTCPPGTADCDGDCTTLDEDEEHCGACGVVCGRGAVCVDGACVGGVPGATSCSSDAECDDGAYCNGTEHCIGGVCRHGQAVVCDDGIACTRDECQNGPRHCLSTPIDEVCSGALQRCTVLDGTSETGCR